MYGFTNDSLCLDWTFEIKFRFFVIGLLGFIFVKNFENTVVGYLSKFLTITKSGAPETAGSSKNKYEITSAFYKCLSPGGMLY